VAALQTHLCNWHRGGHQGMLWHFNNIHAMYRRSKVQIFQSTKGYSTQSNTKVKSTGFSLSCGLTKRLHFFKPSNNLVPTRSALGRQIGERFQILAIVFPTIPLFLVDVFLTTIIQ
jgi:hypothetical protein